jgi:hypothetical protein
LVSDHQINGFLDRREAIASKKKGQKLNIHEFDSLIAKKILNLSVAKSLNRFSQKEPPQHYKIAKSHL